MDMFWIIVGWFGPTPAPAYLERATHIPDEVRAAHPEIPWRMVIATRNRYYLRHLTQFCQELQRWQKQRVYGSAETKELLKRR
jgi:hypothetical protein